MTRLGPRPLAQAFAPITSPRLRRSLALVGSRRARRIGRYADSVAVSVDEARTLALSLPGAVELDHHGRPSFRVGGKIFATLWNETRMNVMLDHGGVLTAVESAPDVCEEVWWAKRLAAVGVTLPRVDRDVLSALLTDAWESKAPKRLLS